MSDYSKELKEVREDFDCYLESGIVTKNTYLCLNV